MVSGGRERVGNLPVNVFPISAGGGAGAGPGEGFLMYRRAAQSDRATKVRAERHSVMNGNNNASSDVVDEK